MTIDRPGAGRDRRARDRRIRELRSLDAKRWTLSRLGREFSLSKPRIVEILDREPTPAERDADVVALELNYRLELENLLAERRRSDLEREDRRRRIVVVARSLRQIAEEREVKRLNRLLGLD